MTARLIILLFAVVGIAPGVLWALASIIIATVSVVFHPVSFSFRLYSGSATEIHFHELSVFTSFCILAGAGLLIAGLISISRGAPPS